MLCSCLKAAIIDLIEFLREYAQDSVQRLQYVPNHAEAWSLVQLVNRSTDDQLADWLRATEWASTPRPLAKTTTSSAPPKSGPWHGERSGNR